MKTLGNDWERQIIRRAMEELEDEEGVRLFDEEEKEAQKEAEAELEEMKRQGQIKDY
mgnify:CR=1 FL=1